MNEYLNIKNSCKIIYGFNGAVIYDFDKSIKYNIFDAESKILFDLQSGQPIEQLFKKYDNKILKNLISNLNETGVGYLSESFIPVEPYRIGNLRLSSSQKTYTLNTAYIELPTDCNKNCSYCNSSKISGCYSCSVAKNIDNKDSLFYRKLIDSLNLYNCKNFIFHGGNPLIDWSFTKPILDYLMSKKDNSSIFIITNDSIIDKNILNYISKNKINLIINVNYTNNYSAEKLYYLYDILHNNIIVNFNVNHNYIDNFKNSYIDLINNYKNITYSIYSDKESLKVNYSTDLPNNPINIDLFNALDSSHPCLFGKISIKSDKKVYPCIGFNNNELLDLSMKSLEYLLFETNNLFNFWSLSLNDIEHCSDCKFRKCCSDCRAFELSNHSNINVKLSCNNI